MDQSQPAYSRSICALAHTLNPPLNNLNLEEEDQCIIYPTGRRLRHDRSRYSSLLIGVDNFNSLETDGDTLCEDSNLDDRECVSSSLMEGRSVHRSCTYRSRPRMALSPLVAAAVALLLCCCSIAVGASTTSIAFVSTVRDSLINTILARQQQQSPLTTPSMAVQRKSPAQRNALGLRMVQDSRLQ